MQNGGARPGAGRPKGSKTVPPKIGPPRKRGRPRKAEKQPIGEPIGQLAAEVVVEAAAKVAAKWRTPLEYMLAVMNDVGTDDIRRDRMAVAAAPFVHARAEAKVTVTKKDQRIADAQVATSSGKYAVPPAPIKMVVNN